MYKVAFAAAFSGPLQHPEFSVFRLGFQVQSTQLKVYSSATAGRV